MSSMYLRPCPFCGGKPHLMWNRSNDTYYIRVWCPICDSKGKSYKSDTNPTSKEFNTPECRMAADAWNLRAYDKIDPNDIDIYAYVKEFGSREK